MKSIMVEYDTWKEIQEIRIDNNLRSMEEALKVLLKRYNTTK